MLDSKVFGIFEHRVIRPHNPLVRGFDETFYAPHSRHTEVPQELLEKDDRIMILADSLQAGGIYVYGQRRASDICDGTSGI